MSICLLRWPRFKGFMWVAIVLLIGAVFTASAGVACKILPSILAERLGADDAVVSAAMPVLDIIVNGMFIAACIYAGVAIVLIVLFAVLRKTLKKREKAAKNNRAAAIEGTEKAPAMEIPATEVCEETVSLEENDGVKEMDVAVSAAQVPIQTEAEAQTEEPAPAELPLEEPAAE